MKNKELFFIALTIFLTIVGWIVADVYHILNTAKVKEVNTTIVKPINVHIDPSIFTTIENKK
jgi:hypothetical protein